MNLAGSTVQRRSNAQILQQNQKDTSAHLPTMPTSTLSIHSSATLTSSEAILLSIFPITLILGSLFSLLAPETRKGLYDPVLQSFPPEVAPSYFARKSNLFNRYFVKVGWFWVTLAFAIFTLARVARRAELKKNLLGSRRQDILPPALQSILRWLLVTSWWIAITQWFFGPALIDRGFRWTGGRCQIALSQGPSDLARNADLEQFLTAAACKAVGGAWRGGHDISGHVFLLVLGSAFLGMEILPVMLRNTASNNEDRTSKVHPDYKMAQKPGKDAVCFATWFAGAIGLLCIWMLLMTAAYFHTWFEKFTGLAVAFAAISTVYFLPRKLPVLRSIIGAPLL